MGAVRLIKTEEGNTRVVVILFLFISLARIMKKANIIFYTSVNVRLSIVIKGDA